MLGFILQGSYQASRNTAAPCATIRKVGFHNHKEATLSKGATMSDEPNPNHNLCPYCMEAFNQQDVVIKIWDWFAGTPTGPEWAHLDCALDASKRENRKHPPA